MTAPVDGVLGVCAALLREPSALTGVDRAQAHAGLERHGPTLLAIMVVCGAVFGGVVGSYRGGAQLLYAAIKLPLLTLLPLLVALPAVRALYRVCGFPVAYGQVAMATLVGCARATLVLAVASPALWLVYSVGVAYHFAVLLMCGALAACGAIGVRTMAQLLPGRGGAKVVAHLLAVSALGVVFAQSGWILRPFVARPRADVTLWRPIESNVFASVAASWRSSRGRYTGWEVRREGLLSSSEESSP
jgi:hypothetical protein